MVPGGARASSGNAYDTEALRDQGLLAEGDHAEWLKEEFSGKTLRWDKGKMYMKDKHSDYHEPTDREVNQLLYGSNKAPDGEN